MKKNESGDNKAERKRDKSVKQDNLSRIKTKKINNDQLMDLQVENKELKDTQKLLEKRQKHHY